MLEAQSLLPYVLPVLLFGLAILAAALSLTIRSFKRGLHRWQARTGFQALQGDDESHSPASISVRDVGPYRTSVSPEALPPPPSLASSLPISLQTPDVEDPFSDASSPLHSLDTTSMLSIPEESPLSNTASDIADRDEAAAEEDTLASRVHSVILTSEYSAGTPLPEYSSRPQSSGVLSYGSSRRPPSYRTTRRASADGGASIQPLPDVYSPDQNHLLSDADNVRTVRRPLPRIPMSW